MRSQRRQPPASPGPTSTSPAKARRPSAPSSLALRLPAYARAVLARATLAILAAYTSSCVHDPVGVGPLPPGCGDGIVENGELCDDGLENSDTQPNACRAGCIPAFCGDAVTDFGEECDDGNLWGGDGCSPGCSRERGQMEAEPNDDPGSGDMWRGEVIFGSTPEGDRDCFDFDLVACSAVEARLLGDCSMPATLSLYDPTGAQVATGAPGKGGCAVLDPAEAPGARFVSEGTWTLCVGGLSNGVLYAYALEITIVDPEDAAYTIPVSDDPDLDGRPDICDDDRDGDGVDDEVDNCPDTPNGPDTPPPTPSASGFIRYWLAIGPFNGRSSPDTCLPTADNLVAVDDSRVTPSIGDLDVAGEKQWAVLWSADDRIAMGSRFGSAAPREAYTAVYLRSATQRDLTLGLGPDDGARAWFNGEEVLSVKSCQGTNVDQFTAEVTMLSGWNTLVVKVYDQGGGWGNYTRFLDNGAPVTNLEISLDPSGPWTPSQSDLDGDGQGDICDRTPL